MSLAPTPAARIKVLETLSLLDGQFRPVAAGVAENRYVFWLGSGISFNRVDGLKQVIPRVIEFLRAKIEPGVADCRFLKALNELLRLIPLSDDELNRADFTRPFVQWRNAQNIVERLIGNYARLLDITVEGEPELAG